MPLAATRSNDTLTSTYDAREPEMNLNGVLPVFYAENLLPVLDFYTGVLGFVADTIDPDIEDPDVIILNHGRVSIMYAKVGPMPVSSGQLNFEVDNVDKVFANLPDFITADWGPEDFDYGRREFAIRDPNGILLVFSMPSKQG